ncbi:SLOG family protein [Streptomyces sp. NRRL F-5135]|uniref:SLOG family protein n=1 Tax=Streptomyces sp. NRRL F-5135 TaxID=1463858 RepID=UPI0004C7A766|nr:SLOG family protein [Streptomyces sp. NRRL F-5135]
MNGPYLALALVTGSRSWDDVPIIEDALLETWHDARQDGYSGITVMHGGATGADQIACVWARARWEDGVGHEQVNADWATCVDTCPAGHRRTRGDYSWCPTAGHRRNQQMVDQQPTVVLAFQRKGSTGTADCIRRAEEAGLHIRRWAA